VIPWVVAVAGFGAAGGIYAGMLRPAQQREQHAVAEVAEAKKALVEAKKDADAGKAAQAELDKKSEENKGLRDDLAKTVAEKADEQKVLDKLKKELGDGGEVKGEGAQITLTLVDKILFKSGAADLTPQGEEVLKKLGVVLNGMPDKMIEVSGHADNQAVESAIKELYPTNWELSTARATNVVRFLQDVAAVKARRLKVAGYGSTRPVASNKTPAGRAKNRRIEILLLPEKVKVVKGDFADEIAAAQPKAGAPTATRPKDADRLKAVAAAKAKAKPVPTKVAATTKKHR